MDIVHTWLGLPNKHPVCSGTLERVATGHESKAWFLAVLESYHNCDEPSGDLMYQQSSIFASACTADDLRCSTFRLCHNNRLV